MEYIPTNITPVVGARIWFSPAYDQVESSSAGHHGILNFSCGHTTAQAERNLLRLTSNCLVGNKSTLGVWFMDMISMA